jgi:hypothetical protein
MNIQSQHSPLKIQQFGETALRVLSAAQQGSVLASVTNAVYLLSERGELCWLIPMDKPMHQRAMQVNSQIPRLNPGSNYAVVDHSLTTSTGDKLDFRHAALWVPPVISPTQVVSILSLSETLHDVAHRLLAQHKPSGLGELIVPILQSRDHHLGASEINKMGVLHQKAWFFVNEMIGATAVNDMDRMLNQAKSLIGFGVGLTPSGDDFLGGFFFSLKLFDRYYQNAANSPIRTYSYFIHQSKPLTNLISYTILDDHAEGHSVEPLHLFANSLLLSKTGDQLIAYLEKLISLGHSTGWDLLAGFLAGMTATLNQKCSTLIRA